MANEGILFSDIFIESEEDFIIIFKSYFNQRQKEIQAIIKRLQNILKKMNTQVLSARQQVNSKNVNSKLLATQFLETWQKFQNIVFLNKQELQLLVIYRGDSSGKQAQFTQLIDQSKVERKRGGAFGIDSGHELIKTFEGIETAKDCEAALKQHLQKFLATLDSHVSTYDAHLIHAYHGPYISKEYQNSTHEHLTGLRINSIFYGELGEQAYYRGQGLGKAYDAFMNHVANYEKQIYQFLSNQGGGDQNLDLTQLVNGSVFAEEGEFKEGSTFPKLLKDSLNSTGWYSSGDIVIVNPDTREVIYNIQLKTTRSKEKARVFEESVSKLKFFFDSMGKDFTESSIEKQAKELFKFFKTSVSNSQDLNNAPQQTLDNLLEILNRKNQDLNIKFEFK